MIKIKDMLKALLVDPLDFHTQTINLKKKYQMLKNSSKIEMTT